MWANEEAEAKTRGLLAILVGREESFSQGNLGFSPVEAWCEN